MSALYDGAIAPAIQEAGYRVKRGDTDEHNEPIMDRIVADIRAAPFVVAELTDNNQGVYYEAGLAAGYGTTVIYCCPDDGQKVHFDVSGISYVAWTTPADLQARLRDRIFATMGEARR